MDRDKRFVWILVIITFLWSALLICGIVALTQVIIAHAEEPKVIMNGEYVVVDKDYANDTVEIFHHQQDAVDINEPPINRISEALDDVDANGRKMEYIGEYTLTYFCPCRKCNGHWGAIDSYGNPLVWGTVAVDPKTIPMKTHLIIDGYDKEFVARDTGGGVNGKHIDVFVPVSHSEALKMGQGEKRKVWIVR